MSHERIRYPTDRERHARVPSGSAPDRGRRRQGRSRPRPSPSRRRLCPPRRTLPRDGLLVRRRGVRTMTVIRPRPLGAPTRRLRRPVELRTPEQPPAAGQPHGGARHWATHYRVRLAVTDTLIVLASVAAAFLIRFGVGDVVPSLLSFPFGYAAISLIIATGWLAALSVGHTRDPRVIGMGLSEYKRVAECSVLAFGVLAILFLIAQVDIARGYFLVALPIGA